jgi:hypothetical protein
MSPATMPRARRRPRHAAALLRAAVAAVLAGAAMAAQAGGQWSVGVQLGWPVVPMQVGVWLPGSAVSVQFGGVHYRHHRGRWYRPWGTRWVVVVPPPGLVLPPEAAQPAGEALPPEPTRADPVIEPRRGQSAAQTEADRRECNRLATTQPAALADASVFHQVVLACLEERGYAVR